MRLSSLYLCVFVTTSLLAAEPTDPAQPQSPPKPEPAGIKYIDQGRFDPRLRGYTTPEGFRVEIVASEPVVVNPVGMAFDTDGSLYVLEWRPSPGDEWKEVPEIFTYRDGTKRAVATMKKRTKDVLKVLRRDEKGQYIAAEVVLEDELPSSILLHDGYVYLASRGTVRRWKTRDLGPGKSPKPEIIAQGFCGFHHHQVSGLTIGNDGWLYITSGDDDNFVEGSDGSRATVLRTGAVFRCRPDGSQMHTFSLGYRNPYRDLAFDAAFNWFHVDNDNEDGSKFTGCRLMHVAEESDFGWRLLTGARCCKPDHVRGAVFGESLGKLPAMLKTGRGSPAGLLIYNDTFVPAAYRGLLYYPDVYRKLIRAYRVAPVGSTFEVTEEFSFLRSDDPLFRPCQMVIGPDGAIYICDWRTDSGGAGKLWGDGVHGRIYRVTWTGTPAQPAIAPREISAWSDIVRGSDVELIEQLASDNQTDRLFAQRELVRRGSRNRAELLEVLRDREWPLTARLSALGALNSFWNDDVRKAFIGLLSDESPDIRRLAAEGLALNCEPGDRAAHSELVKVLIDASPAVRRAFVLAVGKINAPGAADALVNLWKFDEGKDIYLTDAILRGIERTGQKGIDLLADMVDSGSDAERVRAIDAFLAARTRPASQAIPRMLGNPHLTIEQRADLVRSYANYQLDPPLTADAMLDYLLANNGEASQVKLAGLNTLPLLAPAAPEKTSKFLLAMLGERTTSLRLAAIAAVESARLSSAADRLVAILADPSASPEERSATTKALRTLNNRSAVPLLTEFVRKKAETPEAQSLQGELLQTLAMLDPVAGAAEARTLLNSTHVPTQLAAVRVLMSRPKDALYVGELYLAGKLPREALLSVSEGLRLHSAKEKLCGEMLEKVMKDGLKLMLNKTEIGRVEELMKSRGNAMRGRELYLNGKVLACVNCHKLEGIGGQVGPDLTRIWETHSIEKIMESLIEPSKEIKEGYQTYQLATKNGQLYSGLKVTDTPAEVVIRDANGKDIRVARNDIEELAATKESLMPVGSLAQLSYDQFIDLVTFLKDRSAQESLRGLVRQMSVVGPFPHEFQTKQQPETDHNLQTVYDGVVPGIRWQPLEAEPSSFFNLAALYGKQQVSAYLQTKVYSPKAGNITMLVGFSGLGRVWVNGRLAYELPTPKPAQAEPVRVAIPVEAGWNLVLVKVSRRGDRFGLNLRFLGEGVQVGSPSTVEKP